MTSDPNRVPDIRLRAAVADDAEVVGRMIAEFNAYLRALGDETDFQGSAQTFARDGFGADAAFRCLVAEIAGRVVGYLLYHFGYDADQAARVVHMVDLFVTRDCRRQGVASALLRELKRIGRSADAIQILWAVYKPNRGAHEFYRRAGGRYVSDLDYMYLEIRD